MFYLEVRQEDGSLNNIELVTLKNKLGTRQLPTAELLLHGSVAYKVLVNVTLREYCIVNVHDIWYNFKNICLHRPVALFVGHGLTA